MFTVSVPSIAALAPHAGESVVLTGRIVSIDHQGGQGVLADASGQCDVVLAREADGDWRGLCPGQWLVVEGMVAFDGTNERPQLRNASIKARARGTPSSDGYFARFTQGVGTNLRRRAGALRAVRAFFDQDGYCEVNTPARVKAPGTDVYLAPQPSGDSWLITSPEFHLKRLLVGGVPRVYELARCHRQDEAGTWHQPEFVMLEWYQTFLSFDGLMAQTERLVQHVADALQVGPTLHVQERSVRLDQSFERMTVSDAFRCYAEVEDAAKLAATNQDVYFQLLVDRIEPALRERSRPVLLTHYPLSEAALAQASQTHPGYAERFELFIGGIEICNGYGELTSAVEQRRRFERDLERRAALGLPELPIDEGLLTALEEGLPPCSGNALGFDRLVAVLLGEALERVVAFPAKA